MLVTLLTQAMGREGLRQRRPRRERHLEDCTEERELRGVTEPSQQRSEFCSAQKSPDAVHHSRRHDSRGCGDTHRDSFDLWLFLVA